jgi:VanZ family protein
LLRLFQIGFWLAIAVTLYLTLRPLTVMTSISDKTQHLVTFGVLTAWAAIAYPRARLVPLGLALSGLGGLIELLQPLTGRSDDLYDWIADTAGVLIGVTVALAWRRKGQPRGA